MKRRWPQAVIFDMDGLMFGTEGQIQRAWDAVGERFAGEPMGYHIYQTMGMNRASRIRYFKNAYGEDFPFEEFEQAYRLQVREYSAREGIPVKPGLFQLLEVLKKEGVTAVVATGSSRAHAMENLERTKALGFFQFVIAGDMVQYAKPHPEIYQITCKKLGIQPADALVLEDSWNGVRAAHEAGIPVILIPDLQKDSGPVDGLYDYKMDSLAEVAKWLEIHSFTEAKEDHHMGIRCVGRPADARCRQERERAVYDLLDRLEIGYERVDHPACPTIEACREVDEILGTQMCKNLFLCNAQKTNFYLLLLPGEKKFRTKDLSKQIHSARLSFAGEEYMEKYLNILPGAVSIMGLMNDKDNQVKLLIDRQVIEEEYLGCHPCVNTSSLKIKTADILERFLPAVHHEFTVVELPEE